MTLKRVVRAAFYSFSSSSAFHPAVRFPLAAGQLCIPSDRAFQRFLDGHSQRTQAPALALQDAVVLRSICFDKTSSLLLFRRAACGQDPPAVRDVRIGAPERVLNSSASTRSGAVSRGSATCSNESGEDRNPGCRMLKCEPPLRKADGETRRRWRAGRLRAQEGSGSTPKGLSIHGQGGRNTLGDYTGATRRAQLPGNHATCVTRVYWAPICRSLPSLRKD